MLFRLCFTLLLFLACLYEANANPNGVKTGTQGVDLEVTFHARKAWLVAQDIIKENSSTPQHINQLINSDSPYLLSHALQPVNWREWKESFELGSGDLDKLLFISIGYSTCHWCHVMAQESFDDPEVANILNQYFVSVKVDREQWPLVDHKFKSALEVIKGEAGWPLNAILTPDGKLIWVDSYLTKAKFIKVIKGLAKRWNEKPQVINAHAQRIEKKLLLDQLPADIDKSDLVTATMWENELPSQHIRTLQLLQQEQSGEGPRFIRANWGVGLLEQYLRSGDSQLLTTVESHVNSILLSPTYDAIEGGFHRYAVDGNWAVPHYEKMLYTQANTIRLLARLYAITGKPVYKTVISQTHNWVLTWLSQTEGYASAVSAISDGEEGAYYQVTDPQLISALKGDSSELYTGVPITDVNALLVQLSTIDVDWTQSSDIKDFKLYRSKLIKPKVDEKILLSWNSIYAISLLEAYDVTRNKAYLQDAKRLVESLWQALVIDGQAYRSVFNGKASIDANFEDYSWFALANLKLSFYQNWPAIELRGPSKESTVTALEFNSAKERAVWLLDKVNDKVVDAAQFNSLVNLNRDDELSSIQATVYSALSQGYQLTQTREYKKQAKRLGAYDVKRLDELINQYSFITHLSNKFQQVSINHVSFAKGHGRITAEKSNDQILLKFNLEPGWHVNANKITHKKLIPTTVSVHNEDYKSLYPVAVYRKLGFSGEALALYEENFEVKLQSTNVKEGVKQVNIHVQACSDTLCLLPETVSLHISL